MVSLKWKIPICPWFCSFLSETVFPPLTCSYRRQASRAVHCSFGTRRGLCLVRAERSAVRCGRCLGSSALLQFWLHQPAATAWFAVLQIHHTERCIFLSSRGTSSWSCFCSLHFYCFLIKMYNFNGFFAIHLTQSLHLSSATPPD